MSDLILPGGKRTIELPGDLPDDWREVTEACIDKKDQSTTRAFLRGKKKTGSPNRLMVILNIAKKHDGLYWRNASLSYRDKWPTQADILTVYRLFIGDKRRAIQLFDGLNQRVVKHRFRLDLFACEDADVLPDLSFMVNGLR